MRKNKILQYISSRHFWQKKLTTKLGSYGGGRRGYKELRIVMTSALEAMTMSSVVTSTSQRK
jgi:hypothetical protein